MTFTITPWNFPVANQHEGTRSWVLSCKTINSYPPYGCWYSPVISTNPQFSLKILSGFRRATATDFAITQGWDAGAAKMGTWTARIWRRQMAIACSLAPGLLGHGDTIGMSLSGAKNHPSLVFAIGKKVRMRILGDNQTQWVSWLYRNDSHCWDMGQKYDLKFSTEFPPR